ncbi:hypothetical protein TrVE_jg11846 [Triparma verrucosa]|uniref:Cytochrome b5 heme-binding domain-containing protein n=1 Tax=Triparma verrucosa TaxID=1606542 RepID=A0A9W7EKV8_9STRA|nr:hypothetical protein TrVE_jg11846 [Triparma verrucosa]
MAVVSSDHSTPGMSCEDLSSANELIRIFTPSDIEKYNKAYSEGFYAVIEGFVVDAMGMVNSHPGGLKKLMQTNLKGVGYTGKDFGFSFSKGRNAHFPGTGKRWKQKVKEFLTGEKGEDGKLKSLQCVFDGEGGSVIILGKLQV